MNERWTGRDGLVHIVDPLLEHYTWCRSLTSQMYAGQWYKPPSIDLVPTCIQCIVYEAEVGRIRRSIAR